ncbi:MAG: DNA translocase FtsK 4TM domain-containing protein [Proteobacteria bacterium]|nr:DNA translocase FtsK 4TM domain-containing protein [Pseudomonadota bacterium]
MASSSKGTRNSPAWARPVLFFIGALFLGLSLFSYNPQDPSLNTLSNQWQDPKNLLGIVGSWTADAFFQLFGHLAWVWPMLLATAVFRIIKNPSERLYVMGGRFWTSLSFLVGALTLFVSLLHFSNENRSFPAEGLVGVTLAELSRSVVGVVGSYFFVVLLLWAFCFVWWEQLPQLVADTLLKGIDSAPDFIKKIIELTPLHKGGDGSPKITSSEINTNTQNQEKKSVEVISTNTESTFIEGTPLIRQKQQIAQKQNQSALPTTVTSSNRHWDLPPISLLEKPTKVARSVDKQELIETAKKISSALKSFDIQGEITEISPGPTITLYEFQPAPGVRVQKLMSVSTDLAMTLGAPAIRIVAPIPGKSVAGIEVPNDDKDDIVLRDVFETTLDKSARQKLPLVLGKDIEGHPIVEDLSRMPHLLIGGATNMGKSVLVNSILTGLLCRYTPDYLRLIIVDPKLVEFKIYEDIPHLLLPIVNDSGDASQALKWAVNETKRRYLEMQKLSAKNLETYNQRIIELQKSGKAENENLQPYPYIVIIIDELAELMLTGKKDVEQSIVRLSQLARAAGIHLIMATQRPSADVVTGLIKSNCPSRAALRVASASDSRIILDSSGAELLLGKGDMFFTNTGPMGLRRMQGSFVSDTEVEKVCDFWRSQGEPEYKEEILQEQDSDELLAADEGQRDPLFKDVVHFAKEKGNISTSLIQRRFQIGYTRAARIMEQLENAGIVGESAAAGKPREVII